MKRGFRGKGPPKRPRKPPAPIMKIARPGIEEMIRRLQKIDSDEIAEQLLSKARAWPRIVAGRPKEEIKKVRMQAGEMLLEFNRRFSDVDGEGPIRTS